MPPLPIDNSTTGNKRKSQVTFKSREVRVKSPSGQEYEMQLTADDVEENFSCFGIFVFVYI